MFKSRHPLVTLVLCFFSSTLCAQSAVNVEINGIGKILEENVRLYLSIEQQKNHPLIKEISSALQPFGYYRPTISSSLEKSESGEWQASYSIDPGPALRIAEFNFVISTEMGQDPEFQKLIQKQAMQTGSVFTHPEYDSFKAELAKLASERGYFRAAFSDLISSSNCSMYSTIPITFRR
jgi:translocation and assembly module TamA